MRMFDGAVAIRLVGGLLIFGCLFWMTSMPWWLSFLFAIIPAGAVAAWWFR
jgi:hypothetical protein